MGSTGRTLRYRVMLPVLALLAFAARPALANPSLVFDAASGKVLYAEQAGAVWHPASLTKIMTAYIVLQELAAKRLKPNQVLTVSKFAASKPPSKLGVPAGRTITVMQALRAVMIRSTNDMAVVLAEAVSGSEAKFAEKMNRTARDLGMTRTHFVNSHGLHDPRQVTTARDLGLLAQAILRKFPKGSRIFSERYVKWGKVKLSNRNRLLGKFRGLDGLKTGFVCASGFNLVATAKRGGRRLVSVVLGAPTGRFRFDESAYLLKRSFARPLKAMLVKTHLRELRNAGRNSRPPNLRQTVCEKQQVATITPAKKLKGWGIMIGAYKSRKTAKRMLNYGLSNFRGAVTGAQAAVVRTSGRKAHAVILAGLTQREQASACKWLEKTGAKCNRVSPKQIKRPRIR
ncbi:MAG: D-alanyl-D-alanine carboxypeptidase [Hyphomicrobiales bacterium]|nr:MAG: D-alanyl-D-alanine carboxypeptidase [Hyphomicrobiales bacterium]